jgi:hypothetical protein
MPLIVPKAPADAGTIKLAAPTVEMASKRHQSKVLTVFFLTHITSLIVKF